MDLLLYFYRQKDCTIFAATKCCHAALHIWICSLRQCRPALLLVEGSVAQLGLILSLIITYNKLCLSYTYSQFC